MKPFWSIPLLVCISISSALGDEFQPLFRGARAQAMGNAFTAVADDEEAIFYNPAGLAGIKKFSFIPASINLEVSDDLLNQTATLSGIASNPSISSLSQLVGKNIYSRVQATSSIVLPGFGIAGIGDAQAALRMQNQALPTVIVGDQITYGAQAGFGVPVIKFRKKKGEWRIGIAVKMLWRGGGYQQPSFTELVTANTSAVIGSVTSIGVGYGADFGSHLIYHLNKKLSVMGGLAITNMGMTSFSNSATPIPANTTVGIAGTYKNQDMAATVAYDYSNFFESIDFRKKMHMGLELKFPFLSLYGGFNQLYPTYGLGLDFALFKVMYLSYTEELSSIAGLNGERRNMIQFSMNFNL